MTSVQNTHISALIRQLHASLTDIVAIINSPQRDEAIVREAGIPLDRALFPLLVTIERRGPLGVVDLAERIGRDHTTVSRQVAKLEELGLVQRRGSAKDGRVRQVSVAARGKAMTDLVDAARDRIGQAIFASWDESEISELVRLTQKFAAAMDHPATEIPDEDAVKSEPGLTP